MRILITLMLLWMAAPISQAEDEFPEQFIPIACYQIQPFLKNFKEMYGEELVFMSGSVNNLEEELYHQLWMNPSTQTWTFMVSNKPRERICIISSGQGFTDLSQIGI